MLYPTTLSSRTEGQIRCFPNKAKLKEVIISKPLLYEMLKGLTLRKTMNSKMTINSQLSTTEPKKQKQTKQTSRTGTESQKWRSHGGLSAGRRGENGEKVQGIRSIIGKHKTDRGRLRIVEEMEKPKNLYV